jgi:hypothetical protein
MNSSENCGVITGACQSVIAMTEFLYIHQEGHMKISVSTYSLVTVLALITLTGFTCSKHVPEKAPEMTTSETTGENSVPQDQMTDQTTSGDATPAAK